MEGRDKDALIRGMQAISVSLLCFSFLFLMVAPWWWAYSAELVANSFVCGFAGAVLWLCSGEV